MKQYIAVRALIRKDGKTLIVKRASGRQAILGKYELVGGRIHHGEQPEQALQRYLEKDVGLTAQTIQLFDVLSYIDHDDRDTQYIIILYLVSPLSGMAISLSQDYAHYIWRKLSNIDQTILTESTKLLLGISEQVIDTVSEQSLVEKKVPEISPDTSHVIVYSDGGSRGNPGPSAAGFVIMTKDESLITQGGMYLGITTNNQAEYQGVRLGLEKARELGAKTVDFRVDSLLVVNQMNGVYNVKNRELWPINERIRHLVAEFDKVTFSHVKREFNQLADGMVNKILDARKIA